MRAARLVRYGNGSNGTERIRNGMEFGTERYGDRPDPQGRCDVGRGLPFAHGTVGSLGVAVISRDLTRTYSGRCMECIGLGSAIEQLNRYGAFICEYKN